MAIIDIMDIRDAVNALSEQLVQGRCVLFVGSGVSTTYTDPQGRQYPGLPTGRELLEELRLTRTYVTPDMSLLQALTMKYIQEGRYGLLEFIRACVPDYFRDPLPAHREIAKLPLSAVITTNWDPLLETALRRAQLNFHVIVEDTDIPIFKPGSIPIVKFHGTIDRPDTIAATFNDMLDLFAKRPVLSSLLRVLCAQGTLLFLGYALDDVDFRELFRGLRRELDEFMPVSYAVQFAPPSHSISFWASQGVHIVDADVTDFIQRLSASILLKGRDVLCDSDRFEEWMANPFLRHLIGKGTLPTESQVIDGVLGQIVQMLNSTATFEEVAESVIGAIETLVDFRPHYQALRRLQEETLPTWFPPHAQTKEEARSKIFKVLSDRDASKQRIGEKGANVINAGDKILLYSQSTRVLEVVNHWLRTNRGRGKIELIICECRPKSPNPFQDALALIERVEMNDVSLKLIPDSTVAHLMATGQIDKVFLGAHKMIEYPDGSMSITNTTGTLMVAKLAAEYNIPVYMFAEEAKIFTPIGTEEPIATTTTRPVAEENLIDERHPLLRALVQSGRITCFIPGYDDILSTDVPFTVITEKRTLNFDRTSGDNE